ncbi:MAG: 2-C-methyl-D-erythritol 4-phosphate cytidylyltransferase [Muribaculaceae bacterium]|nr:2-C-methyl-D-erythritol 4-phosphate cytidylyltransferase [Muribaculaceae bacterium]
MKKCIVIVAGGKGIRFGGELPKQFLPMNNKPVLMHTIDAFHNCDNSFDIIVVIPENHFPLWEDLCKSYNFNTPHKLVKGGTSRWESVKNGLSIVDENSIIGIHDGVRPLISTNLINALYSNAATYGAVIPAIKVTDSLRLLNDNNDKSVAVNRELYRAVQTPQVFRGDIVKGAYNMPFEEVFTDDASVVERYGIEIKIVEGEDTNIKITSAKDLIIAELLKSRV